MGLVNSLETHLPLDLRDAARRFKRVLTFEPRHAQAIPVEGESL